MLRLFVVKTETRTVMADDVNSRQRDKRAAPFAVARPLPSRIVGRTGFVKGERVQNIGEQQLLMLLFVI